MNASLRLPRCSSRTSYADSPQHRDGRFRNAVPTATSSLGLWASLKLMWEFAFNKPAGTVPTQPLPVLPLTRAELLAATEHSAYRLGHSTVLMKLDGGFWLTDPVFGQRASPFAFAGPKRFHAPPIELDALPPIAGVILSHNHYDHLDRATVRRLAERVGVFITPLGVGDLLVRWGVDPAKVRQLDWWQSTQVGNLTLTAAPSQHFSGRGLFDSGRSLWASWAIRDRGLRVFFSGDSGYFDGFKAIGERLGPFDVTLMENGAYDPQWPHVHMLPEQSLQAHLDVRGQAMLPIHNGTFDLALHTWQDPLERISALADAAGVPLLTPKIGERIDLANPASSDERWWELPVETMESIPALP